MHNALRITVWLTAPQQQTKLPCLCSKSSHVTPAARARVLELSLTVGSSTIVTWLSPTSESCDSTKWVKTISEMMPSSQTHMHISISAQGTTTLIKINQAVLLNLYTLPPSISIPSCVFLFPFLKKKKKFFDNKTDGCVPPELYISFDQNHRHSRAQRPAICATALRWMLAGSLIWEVRHNEPF